MNNCKVHSPLSLVTTPFPSSLVILFSHVSPLQQALSPLIQPLTIFFFVTTSTIFFTVPSEVLVHRFVKTSLSSLADFYLHLMEDFLNGNLAFSRELVKGWRRKGCGKYPLCYSNYLMPTMNYSVNIL